MAVFASCAGPLSSRVVGGPSAASAQQWRLGGGPVDINHTRIIDPAYSEEGKQEAFLSGNTAAPSGSIDSLQADDYPLVPLVVP